MQCRRTRTQCTAHEPKTHVRASKAQLLMRHRWARRQRRQPCRHTAAAAICAAPHQQPLRLQSIVGCVRSITGAHCPERPCRAPAQHAELRAKVCAELRAIRGKRSRRVEGVQELRATCAQASTWPLQPTNCRMGVWRCTVQQVAQAPGQIGIVRPLPCSRQGAKNTARSSVRSMDITSHSTAHAVPCRTRENTVRGHATRNKKSSQSVYGAPNVGQSCLVRTQGPELCHHIGSGEMRQRTTGNNDKSYR